MKIPTWDESRNALERGENLNPLEKFIYEHESMEAEQFRKELVDLISFVEMQASKIEIRRMWVNQPSIHQPFNHLHGENVLASKEYGNTLRIYFLGGDVVSQQITEMALSPGWLDNFYVAEIDTT